MKKITKTTFLKEFNDSLMHRTKAIGKSNFGEFHIRVITLIKFILGEVEGSSYKTMPMAAAHIRRYKKEHGSLKGFDIQKESQKCASYEWDKKR